MRAQEAKEIWQREPRVDWKPESVLRGACGDGAYARKDQKTGEAVYEQVAEHIRREPAQSTRLLEAWIGAG